MSSISVPIAGSTATVAYSYDELGRVTGRTVDGGSTMSTTFDSLGRVTGVSNPLGSFTYAYVDTTSRLSSVTYPSGTGLSTNYSYFGNTGDQRLQEIKNLNGSTQISKFDYTYNPVGTIASWTQQADSSTAVVNTLSYDNADQLTKNVQSGGATAGNGYNYDPAGNRLSATTLSGTTVTGTTGGLFNNLNQLTSLSGTTTSTTVSGTTSLTATSVLINGIAATITGSTSFSATIPTITGTNILNITAKPTTGAPATQRFAATVSGSAVTSLAYDLNGNTTTDENGNTYSWDALNRLTAIVYGSSSPSYGTHTEFAYDGLSRRTQILERAGTTTGSGTITSTKNYLWIGSEIAEERDASNTVTKRFFPQGEQQSGTDYYYTRDHLGSVREMCSSTGTITSRMAYDSYGRVTVVSGSVLPTFQYAGYYYHPASGLGLAGFRTYDSNTGRWLSRDPIAENGGDNIYEYVGDDPLRWNDPYGLKQCPKCGIKKGPEYNVSGSVPGPAFFTWSAEFMNDDTHDPGCCVVHQLIFWTQGSPPHKGFNNLPPNEWYEDRDDATPQHRYGHRNAPFNPNGDPGFNNYSGDGYASHDYPHQVPEIPGTVWKFRLVVVDICHWPGNNTSDSNPLYTSKTLTVTW